MFTSPHNNNGPIELPEGIKRFFEKQDGYVWFIERKSDNKWLTENREYTNDPLLAKQFETGNHAMAYCCVNGIGVDHTQTEHEFVNREIL